MIQAVDVSPLRFSMDVAQLVVLGGLVWRLAEMSAAVKALTKVAADLTQTVSDVVTRVAVLEDRDEARRDRRYNDT